MPSSRRRPDCHAYTRHCSLNRARTIRPRHRDAERAASFSRCERVGSRCIATEPARFSYRFPCPSVAASADRRGLVLGRALDLRSAGEPPEPLAPR
jgi:hypothetical protein